MNCTCGSIGTAPEVRLCGEHHQYWLGDLRLASVSSVIKSVLPTDYAGISPAVLENARQRGVFVDRWFCEYVMSGDIEVPAGVPTEYDDYLGRVIDWWDKSGLKATATQKIVWCTTNGIAGMYDILLAADMIVDLKCVASLQPNYRLQLGAYGVMSTAVNGCKLGILHVTKKDVKLVPYSIQDCCSKWRAAVDWWKVKKEFLIS